MICPTCKQPGDLAAIRLYLDGQIDSLDALRDSLDDGEIDEVRDVVISAAKKLRKLVAELDAIGGRRKRIGGFL